MDAIANVTGPVNISQFRNYFSWHDYILFGVMLVFSASVGIYYGFCVDKQKARKEYFTGGKSMKALPVAISLVASHTSGINLIGVPANIYDHGASLFLCIFSLMGLGLLIGYVVLPIYCTLNTTSSYQYLEMRFDKKCRQLASFLYCLSMVIYLPVIIYGPALAFSAVTGIAVEIITPIICGVCIFYTSLGGLKAVIWTDAIQFIATAGTLLAVVSIGIYTAGGFGEVYKASLNAGLLNVSFSPSLTQRDTFWSIVVGLTIHWASYSATDQDYTQKYLAVKNYKESFKTVMYYCFGMAVVKCFCIITGLVMYHRYANCDPLAVGLIDKKDQLLPYYVLDVAGHIPGLPGLFVAGIFSAALSTMSSCLNALSSIFYEDFLKKFVRSANDTKRFFIVKTMVVIIGIIATSLVFVVRYLGSLFSMTITLMSVTHGPMLGMFALGMLFPRANPKGAFFGTLLGLVTMTTVIGGAQVYDLMGYKAPTPSHISVSGCNATVFENLFEINKTLHTPPLQVEKNVLFRIQFYWYTLIGAVVTMIAGCVISSLTNKDYPPVDKKLMSPVIHFLLPKQATISENSKMVDFPYEYSIVPSVTEPKEKEMEDIERNQRISLHCS